MAKKTPKKPTSSSIPNNQTAIREEITQRIVAALQGGKIPWRRGWSIDENCSGFPVNVANKKAYRGVNVWLLYLTSMERNFRSKFWGTYKQWESIGGQVTKRPIDVKQGEWGTKIVFWKILNIKEKDKAGVEKDKKIFLLRFYTVFNLDQVQGESEQLKKLRPMTDTQLTEANWQPAEDAIAATKADIRYGGNRAFYKPPSGLDFPAGRDYAFGEIVAEMCSSFLCSALNVPQNDDLTNHTAYIGTWLKRMQDDPKFIFQASSWASKASDYILHFSRTVEGFDEKAFPKPKKYKDGHYIQMPNRSQFTELTAFYGTILHELCHHSEIAIGFAGNQNSGEDVADEGEEDLQVEAA